MHKSIQLKTISRRMLSVPTVLLSWLCLVPALPAQDFNTPRRAENLILISLDGLRPEEMFGGADSRLMIPDLGVKDPEKWKARFDAESAELRRAKLLPHLWGRINQGHAWIAGNLERNSQVSVTNGKYFSYPGYNEILSGQADDWVDSNAKRYNRNTTVLEYLNRQDELKGSVMAFCSWDVFPYIINDQRSGIPVNAGWTPLSAGDPNVLESFNFAAANLFHEWDGVRYDVFTASGAMQAMKSAQPRVLYISLGETDDWAHAGRYDRYLLTANQNDFFIQKIWEVAQAIPQYREKTAFIVTTDHGRGDGREGWKSHGSDLPGSERIWITAFGAGIVRSGEDQSGRYTQSQVAATAAALLGYDFLKFNPSAAPPIQLAE